MNYEPECTTFMGGHAHQCVCSVARAAYQRGRQNAAAAIEHLESDHYDMVWVRLAVAAARGEEFEYYDNATED